MFASLAYNDTGMVNVIFLLKVALEVNWIGFWFRKSAEEEWFNAIGKFNRDFSRSVSSSGVRAPGTIELKVGSARSPSTLSYWVWKCVYWRFYEAQTQIRIRGLSNISQIRYISSIWACAAAVAFERKCMREFCHQWVVILRFSPLQCTPQNVLS